MSGVPLHFPLHQFKPSTSADGFCGYMLGGTRCNDTENASVHNVVQIARRTPWPTQVLAKSPAEEVCEETARCDIHGHTPQQSGERTYYDTHTGRLTLDNPPTLAQEFIMYFDGCVELMQRKNLDYGNAWQRQGYMGNLARICSKVDRLRNLLWRSDVSYSEHELETIEDTLRDLANIVVFMHLNYTGGNQWGR